MIIKGTTLDLIEELPGNKGICKCITCGNTDVYNLSYVNSSGQECRACKKYKNDKNGTEGIGKTVKVLLKEEENRLAGAPALKEGRKYIISERSGKSLPNLPLGKEVGDYTLFGYIGEFGVLGRFKQPDSVILRCKRCGTFKEVPLKTMITLRTSTCPNCASIAKEAKARVDEAKAECKNKRQEMIQKMAQAREDKRKKEEERELAKLNKQIEREQAKQQRELDKEQKKRDKIAQKESAKLKEYKDAIAKKNPGFFVKARPEGSGFVTSLICKECGTIVAFTNTNKNKAYECPGCAAKDKDPFYRGTCTKDYTNSVFNGLKIVRQYVDEDGYKCDAVCRQCKNEFNGVDLYDVINRELYCDCEYSMVDIECERCGMNFEVPISKIASFEGKGDECPYCHNEVSQSELCNASAIADATSTLWAKTKAAGELFKGGKNIDVKPENRLVKERTPLYAGTDGEYYYRCNCLEHNTSLILNNTEIENYDHSQCHDSRQHLMNKPVADKLKL